MNVSECPNCKNDNSSHASNCPTCGAPSTVPKYVISDNILKPHEVSLHRVINLEQGNRIALSFKAPVGTYRGEVVVEVGHLPAGITTDPPLPATVEVASDIFNFRVALIASQTATPGRTKLLFSATTKGEMQVPAHISDNIIQNDDGTATVKLVYPLIVRELSSDFDITVTPNPLQLEQGQQRKVVFNIIPKGSIRKDVVIDVKTDLTNSGLVFGKSFPLTILSSDPTITEVIIDAPSSAPVEDLHVTFTASGVIHPNSGETKTLNKDTRIKVVEPGDFSFTLTPPTVMVRRTTTSEVTVDVTKTGSFSADVSFECSSLPPGVTYNVTKDPTSNKKIIALTAEEGAPLTTTPLKVDVIGRGLFYLLDKVHTQNLELTVAEEPPGFSIAVASQATRLVQAGSSAAIILNLKRRGGFTGDVTVDVTAFPVGITTHLVPLVIPFPAVSASFTLAATATAPLGQCPIKVTASGAVDGAQNYHRDETFYVTVEKPDFTVAADPSQLSIEWLKTGSVTVIRGGNFEGDIEVSCQNLPDGVIAPPITIPTGMKSGNITVTVSDKASFGDFQLQFAGTGDLYGNGKSTTRLASSVKLTVTHKNGMFESLPITMGTVSRGNYTVTIDPDPSISDSYKANFKTSNGTPVADRNFKPADSGMVGGGGLSNDGYCGVVLGDKTPATSADYQFYLLWLPNKNPNLWSTQDIFRHSANYLVDVIPEGYSSPDGAFAILVGGDMSGNKACRGTIRNLISGGNIGEFEFMAGQSWSAYVRVVNGRQLIQVEKGAFEQEASGVLTFYF